jgi:hypothetical protein
MMTTSSDDIGVWNNLGTVRAEVKTWLKFPVTATGGNATFRATFTCSNWDNLSSNVLFRPRYVTAGTDSVGQSIRIYPNKEPSIFELPIPQDLQERNVYFRSIEVYKIRWRRTKLVGITIDANLDIKLEELWG